MAPEQLDIYSRINVYEKYCSNLDLIEQDAKRAIENLPPLELESDEIAELEENITELDAAVDVDNDNNSKNLLYIVIAGVFLILVLGIVIYNKKEKIIYYITLII
jgi:hypothetical protein